MRYSWDKQKEERNIEKHGISFIAAARMLETPCLVAKSANPGSDEVRYIAVGEYNKREIAVIYTLRNETIRIISARRARHGERKHYHHLIRQRITPTKGSF